MEHGVAGELADHQARVGEVDAVLVGAAGEHARDEPARGQRRVGHGGEPGCCLLDHARVQMADVVQLVRVLMPGKGMDVVRTPQRELELPGQLVP